MISATTASLSHAVSHRVGLSYTLEETLTMVHYSKSCTRVRLPRVQAQDPPLASNQGPRRPNYKSSSRKSSKRARGNKKCSRLRRPAKFASLRTRLASRSDLATTISTYMMYATCPILWFYSNWRKPGTCKLHVDSLIPLALERQ